MPLTRSETFLVGLIERYVAKHSKQPSDETLVRFRRELIPNAICICENEGWRYDHALERVLNESGL